MKQKFNPNCGGEIKKKTIRWMAENNSTNMLKMEK